MSHFCYSCQSETAGEMLRWCEHGWKLNKEMGETVKCSRVVDFFFFFFSQKPVSVSSGAHCVLSILYVSSGSTWAWNTKSNGITEWMQTGLFVQASPTGRHGVLDLLWFCVLVNWGLLPLLSSVLLPVPLCLLCCLLLHNPFCTQPFFIRRTT